MMERVNRVLLLKLLGAMALLGQSLTIATIIVAEPALSEPLSPLPEGDTTVIDATVTAALLTAPDAETSQSRLDAELSTKVATVAVSQLPPVTTVVPYAEIVSGVALPETAPSVNTHAGSETAQASPITISDVQVEETANGFTLQLEADGELPIPTTSVTGNAAIANISNAMLQLPDGDEFFASDPAEGISLINVTTLPDNQVQIAITGTDAPPAIDISIDAAGLTVSGTPGDTSVQLPDDETIQITVTGEGDDDYFVPDASTATRTNTRILDTPQSIQIVPQQVLEDQQILRVDEALRNVSGVEGRLDAFGPGTNLTIRGFTTGSFTNGAILRDGFRVSTNLSRQETANIERIEVIKGPSSVLYGLNDPGGLVNLVTERPLAEPAYDLEFQIGSFGLIRPTIDITGPVTEDGRLTYRLNAAYQHQDGFRDFETETNSFFIAPIISWDIGDRTNFTVLLEYLNEEIPLDTNLPVVDDRVVNVPRDRILGAPDDRTRTDSLTLGYDLTHEFSDSWRLAHGLRYVSQEYDIIAALTLGFDGATGNVTAIYADRIYRSDDYEVQTSVVGEFNTGSIEHTLLAGFDMRFNRFDEAFTRIDFANPFILNLYNPVEAPPRPDLSDLTPLPPENTQTNQYGIFLQDQITFSEQFILVGSLRYDIVETQNFTTPANNRNNTAWSPRVGLVYQPIETVALYANYSQSFRPNLGTSATGETFEPEQGEGFEVGVKAELLDGNLLATLAYFDITKQNVLTTDPTNFGSSVATGEQRSQGVELDVVGEILPGWNIIANYAYTDARITEDNTNPVGNQLPNSPRHSVGLWTTYQIQQGDLQGLGFGLGFDYVGNREGDLANTFEADSYFLTNAALFYEREDWRLGLNINNLFDVDYISSTSIRDFGNAPGAPTSVVGSVSVQF